MLFTLVQERHRQQVLASTERDSLKTEASILQFTPRMRELSIDSDEAEHGLMIGRRRVAQVDISIHLTLLVEAVEAHRLNSEGIGY